jgi:sugar O-acyltransferase (sialic acid O-acetyltransferase NeuD family)
VVVVSTSIVVVGAGGFGREVIDIIEALNLEAGGPEAADPPWTLLGVVDDSPSAVNLERLADRSVPWLGTLDDFLGEDHEGTTYAVGIGSTAVRRSIAERCDAAGLTGATLVHPTVTMGSPVTVGAGSVICAGVRITTNIAIGRHVHINLNVTVGHDTTIEDYVSLNPLASISGDCVIETGVLIGVGGIVLNALRVGHGATVGGAACVVRDVEPGTTVVGVPARPLSR